ncbi:hypothetical protein CJ97_gp16 [Ralstonia phage RSB2]|uniref:Uncharacterized protein ORF16 n=1 Tax=Ralstonia phage RSB2 TaxID=913183 RepID=E5RUZ6_9CAUD|nr:hypothetical protein CJ97_gp16 [Ralstonia phage RSB2]BAJ51804.1 hypothetical protein [Ralstonia phage RSB2]
MLIVKRGKNTAKTITHKTRVVNAHDFECAQCAFANDNEACRTHDCDPRDFPEQGLESGVTIIWVPRKRLENHDA